MKIAEKTVLLKNITALELHEKFANLGMTERTGRQVQSEVMKKGIFPEVISGAPLKILGKIEKLVSIPNLKVLNKVVSPYDAFARYLFKGHGEEPFESVRIPLMLDPNNPKYIVCVSSQVGCALGCQFCHTGRMGFRRNLSAWEIVDQVIKIQADSHHPVRGVVFMGMGEPMLNYKAVMTAAKIMSEPCGMAIGSKSITISTAGIVSGILRFTKERHPYRLVVSLTSADPKKRRVLMPVEEKNATPDLINALRAYHKSTGIRVTLAWTMISGVNVSKKDASELAQLTKGLPIKIDLVDVNDPTGYYQAPSPKELEIFRDALREKLAMPVSRRYSGGKDINAACGMLSIAPPQSTNGFFCSPSTHNDRTRKGIREK